MKKIRIKKIKKNVLKKTTVFKGVKDDSTIISEEKI